jgi:hypothetical protein
LSFPESRLTSFLFIPSTDFDFSFSLLFPLFFPSPPPAVAESFRTFRRFPEDPELAAGSPAKGTGGVAAGAHARPAPPEEEEARELVPTREEGFRRSENKFGLLLELRSRSRLK